MKFLNAVLYLGFLLSVILLLDVLIPKRKTESAVSGFTTVYRTLSSSTVTPGTASIEAYTLLAMEDRGWIALSNKVYDYFWVGDSVSYQQSRLLRQPVLVDINPNNYQKPPPMTNEERIARFEKMMQGEVPRLRPSSAKIPDRLRYRSVRGLYSGWGIAALLMMGVTLYGFPKRKDMKGLAYRIWPNFFLIPFTLYLMLFPFFV